MAHKYLLMSAGIILSVVLVTASVKMIQSGISTVNEKTGVIADIVNSDSDYSKLKKYTDSIISGTEVVSIVKEFKYSYPIRIVTVLTGDNGTFNMDYIEDKNSDSYIKGSNFYRLYLQQENEDIISILIIQDGCESDKNIDEFFNDDSIEQIANSLKSSDSLTLEQYNTFCAIIDLKSAAKEKANIKGTQNFSYSEINGLQDEYSEKLNYLLQSIEREGD